MSIDTIAEFLESCGYECGYEEFGDGWQVAPVYHPDLDDDQYDNSYIRFPSEDDALEHLLRENDEAQEHPFYLTYKRLDRERLRLGREDDEWDAWYALFDQEGDWDGGDWIGNYKNAKEYAMEFVSDHCTTPDWVVVDWNATTRDLLTDLTEVDLPNGSIALFGS